MDAFFDSIDADFEMIRRKGTLVSVGNASGPVPPFPPLRLTPKNVTLLRPTYVVDILLNINTQGILLLQRNELLSHSRRVLLLLH